MTLFTAGQIEKAAKAARDNWDFNVYIENGESVSQVQARKTALDITEEEAAEQWPDGLDCKDIFDYLEEFSTVMASGF